MVRNIVLTQSWKVLWFNMISGLYEFFPAVHMHFQNEYVYMNLRFFSQKSKISGRLL